MQDANNNAVTSLIRSVFESEITRLVAVVVTVMGFVNLVVLPVNEMRNDILYIRAELVDYVVTREKIVASSDLEKQIQDNRLMSLERRVDVIAERLKLPPNVRAETDDNDEL